MRETRQAAQGQCKDLGDVLPVAGENLVGLFLQLLWEQATDSS